MRHAACHASALVRPHTRMVCPCLVASICQNIDPSDSCKAASSTDHPRSRSRFRDRLAVRTGVASGVSGSNGSQDLYQTWSRRAKVDSGGDTTFGGRTQLWDSLLRSPGNASPAQSAGVSREYSTAWWADVRQSTFRTKRRQFRLCFGTPRPRRSTRNGLSLALPCVSSGFRNTSRPPIANDTMGCLPTTYLHGRKERQLREPARSSRTFPPTTGNRGSAKMRPSAGRGLCAARASSSIFLSATGNPTW